MILIEIHGKTLRVSAVNDHHGRQGKTADLQHGQPRKPLGSPSFIGRKRVVMSLQANNVVPI
jgi:hypothetical protein